MGTIELVIDKNYNILYSEIFSYVILNTYMCSICSKQAN